MTAPATKVCTMCKAEKPITEYHKRAEAKDGHQSYCKPCDNERARLYRVRKYTPEQRARWGRKTRYGMTQEQFWELLTKQDGKCALCEVQMNRICVDHCHNTGAVRGLLCHKCNIRLGGFDDLPWREKALRYLGITKSDGEAA